MDKECKEMLEEIVSKIVDEEVVRPTCPPGIRETIIRDIVGYIVKADELEKK